MKRLIIPIVLSIVLLISFTMPVMAWGGGSTNADTNITVDIFEDPDEVVSVGTDTTIAGVITVEASAASSSFFATALSQADASYVATNPNGVVVASDTASAFDWDIICPDTEASVELPFSVTFTTNAEGIYTVDLTATAFAAVIKFFGGAMAWEDFEQQLSFSAVQGGSNMAEYAGQFMLILQTWSQKQAVNWVEDWPEGRTIASGIDLAGRVDTNNVHDMYRIVIPDGTEVSNNGGQVSSLKYYMLEGTMQFDHDAQFSNTCAIYKADDGKWVLEEEFNAIVGGQPVLN